MKVKKIIFLTAVIVAVCIMLTGCSSVLSLENSDLMRPPRATGDRAQIQEVIDSNAGSGYTLKYPQGGDYRSAIIMHDITGDGNEEALAIYRTSGEAAETHILLIDEVNGIWSPVGDFNNSGPEVSQINFVDLDGDGAKEIIVGYSGYSSLVSSLGVYSYNGVNAQSVTVNETYSNMVIGDFTGNGFNEIVLMSLMNNETPANARLMYYSKENNTLTPRSVVEMDSGVSRFISINYCRISNDVFAIAADGQSMDNNYYTQLVYFDRITGQLKNSLYAAVNDNKSAHRQDAAICCDIDKDGITEIPVSGKMPYDPATEIEELVASELIYYEYDTKNNIFIEDQRFISNPNYGYYFEIPEDLKGKITARIDSTVGTLSVFAIRTDVPEGLSANQTGTLMFTIKAFDADQWKNSDGYELILKTDSLILGFAVPEGNPYRITQQKMVKSIMIIDSQ